MVNEINVKASGYNVNIIKSEQNKLADDTLAKERSAKESGAVKRLETSVLLAKKQLNTSILKSNLEVSVRAGNEPLALLYKAAIEGINQVLEGEFGEGAIQNAYDAGVDVSPKATADRIVSISTGFFSQYKDQNPEMSEEEAALSFAEIIRGGIDTGFAEAREVLSGLEVLEGDIASNIDSTYALVQQGLQAFVDAYVDSDLEKIIE